MPMDYLSGNPTLRGDLSPYDCVVWAATGNIFGGASDGPGDARGFWFSRWWKYMENVTGGGEVLPLEYGRYVCREHNFHLQPGEKRLYTFTLFKDNWRTPKLGQAAAPMERQTVWVHRCFDKPADLKPKAPAVAVQTPAR